MKKLRFSTILLIFIACSFSATAQKQKNDQSDLLKTDQLQNKKHRDKKPGTLSPSGNYHYAYSADGYNQDRDDVAASAMTLALFDRAGLADRIVHFHFNTNFGGEPKHAGEHRKSALETAVLFKIIKDVDGDDAFFDISCSENEKKAAIVHLALQIRKATKKEPLMIFAAGGVQVPYAALKKAIEDGADKKALESVVFISHATANEQTARKNSPNADYQNNWDNLKQLSPYVRFVDSTSPLVNGRRDGGINKSQNSTAWEQSPRSKRPGVAAWRWLADYGGHVDGFGFTGTKGEWLLGRLKAAGGSRNWPQWKCRGRCI